MERFSGGRRLKEMKMEKDYGGILMIMVKWKEIEEEEDDGKVL